jgi:hypothetical protein
MGRVPKRKATTASAPAMAEIRDAGWIRSMKFKEIHGIMSSIGTGQTNSDPILHQIQLRASTPHILSTFMGAMMQVLTFDLSHPSYFTPHRVGQWKDIAREISKSSEAVPDRGDTTKKVFGRIARQLGVCEKKLTDLIHYDASEDHLKFALYDVVLKISMDHNIDLKGLFPAN